MPVLQNLQKLLGKLSGGFQNITGSGPGPLTPEDVVSLQTGPQENRGFGNIMQNISLIGAQKRAAQEQLTETEQDRQAKLDLMKAQAENYRSLGDYRGIQSTLGSRRLDIQEAANNIRQAKNNQDYLLGLGKAQTAIKQLEIDEQNASAHALTAQTGAERSQWEKVVAEKKLEQTEARDAVNKAIAERGVAVQEGHLEIAKEKAPGEMVRTGAQTENLGAKTAATTQDTEQKATSVPLDQVGKLFNTLKTGQNIGVVTPKGAQTAVEHAGSYKLLGLNPPGALDFGAKAANLIGAGIPPPQTARTAPATPAIPVKPATPAKPVTKPAVAKYKIGDTVIHQGVQKKIIGIYPDGSLQLEPVKVGK